ncbi:MAG: UDP-N-acetylmuramoyl-L-alanine--D-glutamate ligase [Chitinispirillales bacterium]|jgi:UDP-N-acetylmuramoylalanine--D-glutamate ligase|nr:UDP-N-acetylmuramoyl-L-alanine--D-glutamate ligase [Chitinispirillales bacterium]
MINTNLDNIKNVAPARVAVIGAAKSGIAAAKYFHSRGAGVLLSDSCSRERLDEVMRDNGLGDIESEAGAHSEKVLESDLIILSPGVCSDIDILKSAAVRGIPVWSEMELGFRVSSAPFLAVTGSSGKSTTVSLLGSAMRFAGFDAVVAGNIGLPVISVTPDLVGEKAVVIAEVSSFQLETVERFKPKAAAVINLMKNHLDRYKNELEYYNAKKRIVENLTFQEFLVLNMDDSILNGWAKEFSSKTKIVMFGHQDNGSDCVFLSDQSIRYRFNGKTGVILDDVGKMKLGGKHNYINACAAGAMALCGGADPDRIALGLCDFSGLPHRLEYVADIDGVAFYNDSKSTTAESIECAVTAFNSKVHLIAGGKDKGCDFSVIKDAVRANVKSIALIGEAADRMFSQLDGLVPVSKAADLQEAIGKAFRSAVKGEKVIFSPGCSSFDMFRNFEHRGEVFRDTVKNFASRKAAV